MARGRYLPHGQAARTAEAHLVDSDGRAAGVVVIESRGPLRARLKAALAGADQEIEFASGHQLDPASAGQIPAHIIGRFFSMTAICESCTVPADGH
jgi:hypothetical protein